MLSVPVYRWPERLFQDSTLACSARTYNYPKCSIFYLANTLSTIIFSHLSNSDFDLHTLGSRPANMHRRGIAYHPKFREVCVSRDVVFDESASCYEPNSAPSNPAEEELDSSSDDDIRPRPVPLESLSSTMMSGPKEPPSTESISWQGAGSDKGKGKMPEYEVDHPDESDSDVLAWSLDSELSVPIMWTHGVKKLTSANEKLWRSSQEKSPVTRFGYNEYMAHHYAFTMKVGAN